MCVDRCNHGSTILNQRLYVYGGQGEEPFISAIEFLEISDDLTNGQNQNEAEWQLLEIEESLIGAKRNPIMCALNEREILILGGGNEQGVDAH